MAINLSDAEAKPTTESEANDATKEVMEWFSVVKETTWDRPVVSRQSGSQIYRFDLCPIWGKEQCGSILYSVDFGNNWFSYAISLPAKHRIEDCKIVDEKNVRCDRDCRAVRSGISLENVETKTVFYEVVLYGKDWTSCGAGAAPDGIVEFVREQLVFK